MVESMRHACNWVLAGGKPGFAANRCSGKVGAAAETATEP